MQTHLPQPKFSKHWQTKVPLWEFWDSSGGFCSPEGGAFEKAESYPSGQLTDPDDSYRPRKSSVLMKTQLQPAGLLLYQYHMLRTQKESWPLRHQVLGTQTYACGCGPWCGLQSAQPLSAIIWEPLEISPPNLVRLRIQKAPCNWVTATVYEQSCSAGTRTNSSLYPWRSWRAPSHFASSPEAPPQGRHSCLQSPKFC